MAIELSVQYAAAAPELPTVAQLKCWAEAALVPRDNAELTIRIVDAVEGGQLNERWRKSPGATNVLSFPSREVARLAPDLLGDVVICAPVVIQEAEQQNKNVEAHWAHILIHGVLHLTGYDHQNPEDATRMENLEISILEKLGYQNPYFYHE